MSPSKSVNALFDAVHSEEINPQEPELSQLSQLLEKNGISTHSIATSLEEEDLTPYQVIVLGNPRDSTFTDREISRLVSFVEAGGGLLVLSGATIFRKGGDVARNTNLNVLLKQFQLEFSETAVNTTLLSDDREAPIQTDMVTAIPASQHPVVSGIHQIIFTSATSVITSIDGHPLLRAFSHPGSPIIAVALEVKQGRVLVLGGTTPFFNTFIESGDHSAFIVQSFRWLARVATDQPVIPLHPPLTEDAKDPSRASIEELRNQLNRIEEELHILKSVINSSLKEMKKVIRQYKQQDEGQGQ